MKKFQRIFPIIATTSISAHKIGKPGTYFDMVIMDEASQGNIAMSLVPIIRGRSLMLVGDPQQLSPVILLNQTDNEKLKKMLSELWSGLSLGVKMTEAEYAKKSIKEHEDIIESMKKYDTMEAWRRMHQHIERSLEDVLTEFEK